jgi:pimeloyl-ACP methyl ester carboxylesterase
MKHLKVLAFLFLGACLAALVLPASAQTDTAKTIQTKIDIGGYALYVNIAGEGSPTVILEAGGGNTSSIWGRVQPEISKITRTFSYDRAGLGKSDKRNLPNTCLTQVQELHTLLKKAEVKEPYIYVANSYGAFLAELFASMYPKEVAGVVFVDGTDEKFGEYLSNNLSPEQLDIFKKMAASSPDGNFEEMLISAQQVKEARKQDALRNMPVIVLTADIGISAKQYANTPMSIAFSQWMNWQQDLVALSDKSKQYIIKGSGHLIHYDKPEAVINAIKKLIDNDLKGS